MMMIFMWKYEINDKKNKRKKQTNMNNEHTNNFYVILKVPISIKKAYTNSINKRMKKKEKKWMKLT